MDPGEGLNKIWMCPSSEMANILLIHQKKSTFPYQESVNIIENLDAQKRLSSDQRSGESSKSSSTMEFYSDESTSEDDKITDLLSVDPVKITPCSSQEFLQDERIDFIKMQLKEMYCNKLAVGAQELTNYSVNLLNNRLNNLVRETRRKQEERVKEVLGPYFNFMIVHQAEVNRENGSKLMKKYRVRRTNYITSIIDAAEENFHQRSEQIDRQARDLYHYKLESVRHENIIIYTEKLREKMSKMTQEFNEERNDIKRNYKKNVQRIKEKYYMRFKDLNEQEQNWIDEQVQQFKLKMEQENKTSDQVMMEAYENCSETSSWLCVLSHLITDMQKFISKYIKSEIDLKRIIINLKEQKKTTILKNQDKHKDNNQISATGSSVEELSSIPSINSIPCSKINRNENDHRLLIRETRKILQDIITGIEHAKTSSSKHSVLSPTPVNTFVKLTGVNNRPKPYDSDEDRSTYRLVLGENRSENSV